MARSWKEKVERAKAVRELDFRRIFFTPPEIDHARAVVAASACEDICYGRMDFEDAEEILTHLGLMPNQTGWYYSEADPYTPRRTDG